MSQYSPPKKLILFDIDGTLLLTGGAGAIAFNRTFQELYDITEVWQGIHPDGKTDPVIIEELFLKQWGRKPKAHEEKAIEARYAFYMEEALQQAPRFRLMAGIHELLSALEDRQLGCLGLATGNYESTAWLKLKRAGLDSFFHFGGFGSDSRDRLALTRLAMERGMTKIGSCIHPEDVWVVGDTIHDIRCGKLLGATTVAVATGSTSWQILQAARPDFLLESFADLEESLTAFL